MLSLKIKTAPVFRAAPEVEVEAAQEVVYEMNKTDKKIWSKDFEIIDNRNGLELGPVEENGKWAVRNKVTGQMVTANTKKDARNIIANAPAYAEAFGEGTKVESDMVVTPGEIFSQEVADLEAFINEANPQFQLSTKVTPENKKKELEAEALRLMENFEEEEMASVAFSIKKLKQTKDALPENYWTVSEVEDETGLVPIDVEGGSGFVDAEGDIKGVYKFTEAVEKKVKGVADRILKKAVDFGGIKLDNFDNYLTLELHSMRSMHQKVGTKKLMEHLM